MPTLRDHSDLLQEMTFFQLSTVEQQALTAFNDAFIRANTPLFDQSLKHFIALKTLNNPAYQIQAKTLATLKAKALTADSSHFPFILPDELLALPARSLIKLAFAHHGDYFYLYLTETLRHEIFKRTNSCDTHPQGEFKTHEQAQLTAKLNTLSTTAWHQRLNHSWPSTNSFYLQIESLFEQNNYLASDLLGAEHALELIASTNIRNILLNRKLKGVTAENAEALIVSMQLTPSEEQLLLLAATNGCYAAAYDLTLRCAHRIENSLNLTVAMDHYQHYCQTLFNLSLNHYQTAAYLLLVQIQLSLLTLCQHKIMVAPAELEPLLINIYHHLKQAEWHENTCKNTLRLAFHSDQASARLQQLVPRDTLNNPQTFDSITALRQFFKRRYAHLSEAFDAATPPAIFQTAADANNQLRR